MILPAKPMKLRFSIRALLLLMTALALFFGYHLNWIRQRRAAIVSGDVVPTYLVMQSSFPHDAPVLLRWLGEKGCPEFTVYYRDQAHRALEMDRVRKLFPEAKHVFAEPLPNLSP